MALLHIHPREGPMVSSPSSVTHTISPSIDFHVLLQGWSACWEYVCIPNKDMRDYHNDIPQLTQTAPCKGGHFCVTFWQLVFDFTFNVQYVYAPHTWIFVFFFLRICSESGFPVAITWSFWLERQSWGQRVAKTYLHKYSNAHARIHQWIHIPNGGVVNHAMLEAVCSSPLSFVGFHRRSGRRIPMCTQHSNLQPFAIRAN